ncbi:MAG: hypothetical protein MR963_00900, partial [Bacteroidales bacterium]|nr:hypothetical protein [Bacteroidales bacterium]
GARVVEEARLESVYTPKGYQGFESLSLRKPVAIRQALFVFSFAQFTRVKSSRRSGISKH